MHELDEVEVVRAAVVPQLDRLLKPLDLYAELPLRRKSYALSTLQGVEATERTLSDIGVLRNGMASYKTLTLEGEEYESDGSWAWRYDMGDFWSYRWFGDRQLHITLIEDPHGEETHVFAHDELNPWTHPGDHYHGESYRVDWAIERCQRLFAASGHAYRVYPSVERALRA